MFDFGLAELLLIAAIAILVMGPKEIPTILFNLGRLVRRLQYVRYAFSQQFEDFMKANDLEELRKGVNFEASPVDENGEVLDDEKKADES